MRSVLRAGWFGLLTLILSVQAGARAQPAGGDDAALAKEEQEIVDLTNAERKKEKLPAYKVNATLTKVARDYSAVLAKAQKLDHYLDDKVLNRVKKAGYPVYKVGENLGKRDSCVSVPALMKAWMESQAHKKNILFPEYTEIGVGAFKDDKGQVWYTQVFALPQKKQ